MASEGRAWHAVSPTAQEGGLQWHMSFDELLLEMVKNEHTAIDGRPAVKANATVK